MVLGLAGAAPVAAELAQGHSRLQSAVAANHSDPLVGPFTREDARHEHDVFHFQPASGAIIPRATLSSISGRTAANGSLGLATAYNKSGLQKEVFAFAPYWSLSEESTWDYSVMSTVAYFGLTLSWDGSWYAAGGGWQGYFSQSLVDMIDRAHAAGDRVVLTVKSSGQAALNDVVTQPDTTSLAINNIIGAIANRGFDGVNIDFEGYTSSNYPNIQSGLTNFMGQLSTTVHTRWPGAFVSIDTYSGSASWDFGLFKIDALAPLVDAMFVMAYDMSFSNMSGYAGPNAPITGWTYNDTLSVTQYLTKAPASKIILGVPWYGYRFTTNSGQTYAQASSAVADSYAQDLKDISCGRPIMGWDNLGQSPYAIWYSRSSGDPCGSNLGKWQELYFDNAQSLGIKYNLVNTSGIRGTGIWALGYDGGAPELWGGLHTYFSCPVTLNLAASETTSEFSVGLSAGTCSVASYDVQQYDSTLNAGWYPVNRVMIGAPGAGADAATADGFRGHSYQFRARAHSRAGVVSPWATASTTVAADATLSYPFAGVYTADVYGGVTADSSPPLSVSAYWAGWPIARGAHGLPGTLPQSGAVLDAFGGLHPYGSPVSLTVSGYWPGWDIARDFAFLPDGSGGYVLDGYGGLHPFSVNGKAAPPAPTGAAYWPGSDVARKVVIFSDGTGGYVLDAFGGVHPFGIGQAKPASVGGTAYWSNRLARDVVLIPGTHSGYVLDAYGGLHPFAPTGSPLPVAITAPAYWPGWDIARGVWLEPASTPAAPAGYMLDGFGGLHPFGGAPALKDSAYWPGHAVASGITGG